VRSGAVVAEVVRSGLVESQHSGSVLALRANGELDWSLGDINSPMFPRSANKPVQSLGMLRCGLDLDGQLLALASASHSGEAFQLEGVREILSRAGLSEQALQTPPGYPLDEEARTDYIRAGGRPARIAMNCSGKHAAMLATCVASGWPVQSYLDRDHPLQVAVAATFAELTAAPVPAVGVDGCGAPLLGSTLTGLGRAFQALAVAAAGSLEHRVAEAFRHFPTWASGTRRDEARLLAALPGAIGKAGAEGVYALALSDGRTVALKIDDGAGRARTVVMAAALRRLGIEHPVLEDLATAPVLGGGREVGAVRAVIPLS
jgi:L-asparaginase II